MNSTVPLLTAPDYFTASYNTVKNPGKYQNQDFGLFDEQNLLDLHINQMNREKYVRDKLMGRKTSSMYGSYYDDDEYIKEMRRQRKTLSAIKDVDNDPKSHKNVQKSIQEKQSNIARLKVEIERVKKERMKIISEGEKQVRDYMAQLKKEQSEYAKATQKLRQNDEHMNSLFLKEVSDLDKKISANKEPIEEIKRRVKNKIQESQKGKVSISSIKLADDSDI